MSFKNILPIVTLIAASAFAQQPADTAPTTLSDTQTIIVTGAFEPLPLAESNRAVVSFDTPSQSLLFNSGVEFLRLDPSIDLRERAGDGIQADISIRGSSFGQTLILLNGFRINDAQTAHHNFDIPLPLEAISRIEVLHGAGSTLYGADAMSGAVNLLTAKPEGAELRILAGGGNFRFNQQRVIGTYSGNHWSERITGSRDASTGFRPDRDYRSSSASSESWLSSPLGATGILFAGSDRPFGADQFYGPFPSWERTKSWFASIQQELGRNTSAGFGYRRHSDEFVLIREQPLIYENNHISQSWQGELRRISHISSAATLAYGIEEQLDQIDSNNLGHHGRNRGAGYLNLDLRAGQRFLFSIGGREEVFSGGDTEFSPTVAVGYHLAPSWKLRASASRGFRLPTYTDLYYRDPANIGNPNLKPESDWNFEGGPEWNSGGPITAQLTLFHRRDRNVIDYVKDSNLPSSPYRAENIESLHFTGVESFVRLRLPTLRSLRQSVDFGYTFIHASEGPTPGITSKYVFEFPNNNAGFTWQGQFKNALSVRNRVGVVQRYGQTAYPLWDVAASRLNGQFRPYVQLSNLSGTGYVEIPGVVMPGRSIVAGVEWVLTPR